METDQEYVKAMGNNGCVEKVYNGSYTYNFYVVDPIKHNNGFYPKDSIYTTNKILKEYKLNSGYFKNYNYQVTYP